MLKVNPKEVSQGDTFLVLPEIEEPEKQIEEAIDRGAVCIITNSGEYSVKTIIKKDTRAYLTNYLKELYLNKLEQINIIGIAGTNGKTTSGFLTCQLLNSLNSKTAQISTDGFYINGKLEETNNPNPDVYEIYELINKAIENECENIIIETSSQAIKNRHLEGIKFDMAVYTNTRTKELDEEQIVENINAKIELFKNIKRNGYAIINKNDKYYENFVLTQNKNIYYGKENCDYNISNILLTYEDIEFDINDKKITIPILGSYNVYNFLVAYIIARTLNFPEEMIIEQAKTIKSIDGRYQNIKNKKGLVIIDNADKKSNIKNVIKYTREFCRGRIITLIGCDGETKREEREQIGKTVTKNSDYVIFTTDNPRYDDPEQILYEMTKKLDTDNFEIISSRREAIKKGINILDEYDILLILGRGNDEHQIIGSDKIPYQDYEEVMKNIKK